MRKFFSLHLKIFIPTWNSCNKKQLIAFIRSYKIIYFYKSININFYRFFFTIMIVLQLWYILWVTVYHFYKSIIFVSSYTISNIKIVTKILFTYILSLFFFLKWKDKLVYWNNNANTTHFLIQFAITVLCSQRWVV